ncbi:MAG TPA: hypothetical protein VKV79_00745 [Terriglobia bacterium]|nr:hypothetical protein [Terriglobia bacterium]
MSRAIVVSSLLLALCALLEAAISVVYFGHVGSGFVLRSSVLFLGKLTLAAAICAIAAGLWRFANRRAWLLVLNGLALAALGLMFNGAFGFKISFRTIALVMIVMAASISILETARHRIASVASTAFAVAFLVFALGWIKLSPTWPGETLLLLGAFFAFSALCLGREALQSPPSLRLA